MFKRNRIAAALMVVVAAASLSCVAASEKSGAPESTSYDDLLGLFHEFREFQQPLATDGVQDYSAAAMEQQYAELKTYQSRLATIDPSGWPIPQQSDYHLVRAEMNGMEFQHRVLRPWSIDPGFYNDVISRVPRVRNLPLDERAVAGLQTRLGAVAGIIEQAKANLDDFSAIAGDLGTLAVLSLGDTRVSYESLAGRLANDHPELVSDVEGAVAAIDEYVAWIEANKPRMTAKAGVGKENYNWLLKNVYLFPYTWEEVRTMVELEDNRVITFQKLEENRNRDVPAITPVQSQAEYKAGIEEAVAHVLNFLRDEEIFTMNAYTAPDEYFESRLAGKGYGLDKPWPERHDYFFNFSHREAVMENTHELVGHHFDGVRSRSDDRPIRGGRRPYKIGTARGEGVRVCARGAVDARGLSGRDATLMEGRSPTSRPRSVPSAPSRTSICTAATGATRMPTSSASTTPRMENCSTAPTISGSSSTRPCAAWGITCSWSLARSSS